jgi:hypothetical protein
MMASRSGWCVAVLLAIYVLLLGWAGWATGWNRTEVGHMGATVYFWKTLRFNVFDVNPPLTRMVTGLPVVIADPKFDWTSYSAGEHDRCEWELGRAFIIANGAKKARWCFATARWSLIPLLVLGAYFGYRLSREIFGVAAGLVFLCLWCFSPTNLAWGATICPDAVAAAFGLVGVYWFRRWLHEPNWTRAAVTGASLGLLPLTKLTWLIAFAVWPLIWCFWRMASTRRRAGSSRAPSLPMRQMAAILFVGLYTVNMGYFFDGTCRPLGQFAFVSQSMTGVASENESQPIPGNRFAGTWLAGIAVPLPADLVQGIDTQRRDFERGLPSYLRGQWADHGSWYYYIYASTVKIPLGAWFLLATSVAATLSSRGIGASWRDEMVVLVPGLAVLLFVSSQTGFSIHFRYVLPAIPFLLVWASKASRVLQAQPVTWQQRTLATAIVASVVWSAASSLWVYPHSLSYFNELAGGPRRGALHLLGSNISWDQDLPYLARWLDRHPSVKLDGLACFEAYPTVFAGVPKAPRPPIAPQEKKRHRLQPHHKTGPQPGWYALSVNYLYDDNTQYRYFLHFEPVAMAGYSIYIYHISVDDANRVRRELGLQDLPGD